MRMPAEVKEELSKPQNVKAIHKRRLTADNLDIIIKKKQRKPNCRYTHKSVSQTLASEVDEKVIWENDKAQKTASRQSSKVVKSTVDMGEMKEPEVVIDFDQLSEYKGGESKKDIELQLEKERVF